MSSLHHNIIEILYELCVENPAREIYADHIGEARKPIILTARSKIKPEAKYYFPDLWVTMSKSTDVQIFEVWHSETRSDAVEDILFSSFVKDLTYLHIVCTGGNLTVNDANELVNLILNNVRDENGELRLKPNDVYITEIPQDLQKNRSKMKSFLAKELAFV